MVALLAGCGQSPPSGQVAEVPVPPSPSLPTPAPLPTTPPEPSATAPAPAPVPTPVPTELPILSIIDGDIFILKPSASEWVTVQAGMVLEPGDMIKTGDDSNAEITFFEGSVLELKAGSQIQVILTQVSRDTGSTTILLKQEIGKTISRVNKLSDTASRYEIETPAGVAAVRGSVMFVYVDENGVTQVTNNQGIIFAIAQGVELKIRKNRTAIIVPGKPPVLVEEDEEEEDEGPDNG